jgi:hypothetical protein
MTPVRVRGPGGRFVSLNNRAGSAILLAVALSAGSLFGHGQVFWQEDGVSIRDSTAGVELGIVPDDSGGAIVVWSDLRRSHSIPVVYSLRVDSSGTALWPDSGVPACLGITAAYLIGAAADGRGGAVLCWMEVLGAMPFQINAQRMSRNGTRCWGDNAMVVFDTAGSGFDIKRLAMCSDGQGGCVVVWDMEYYGDDSIVLRAQHVDSLGRLMWGEQGRRIARDLPVYGSFGVVDLGPYGFVFTWIRRNGEIYAQRVDTAGTAVWTVPVCSGPAVYGYPIITRLDTCVLVCWTDMRHGDWDVYAQKLNPAGSPIWAPNGVPVCRADGRQGGNVQEFVESLRAVAQPDGGAVVAFSDRGRGRTAVSCQRLSAAGEMMWDTTGVEAGRILDRDTVLGNLWFGLVADTSGGAIVTWSQFLSDNYWQIWAQRVNGAGTVCWDTGVAICGYGPYPDPPVLRTATDGKGGAIGCWRATRFVWPYWSVYGQRYGDAPVGLAESGLGRARAVLRTRPNPVRTAATISLPLCGERKATLDLFDACGRKVCCLWQGRATRPGTIHWVRTDDSGRRVPAGVYVLRLVAGGKSVASELVTVVR